MDWRAFTNRETGHQSMTVTRAQPVEVRKTETHLRVDNVNGQHQLKGSNSTDQDKLQAG